MKPSCSERQQQALARLLLGSDWLRYKLGVRKKDHKRASEFGERLIYAVDSNIPYLYVGYKSDVALDFANLVRSNMLSENDKLLIKRGLPAINNYISIYILFKLVSDDSLLLFPGVVDELGNAIRSWQSTYTKDSIDSYINQLIKCLPEAPENDEDDSVIFTEWIREASKTISNKIETQQQFEQCSRIRHLLSENRLVKAVGSDVILGEGNVYTIERPSLDDSTKKYSLSEVINYRTAIDKWCKRLLKEKHEDREYRNTVQDAEALTLLERINSDLRQYNCRLVFITADLSLFSTCSKRPYEGDAFAEQSFDNFAEAYLRHPYAFLADSGAWPASEGDDVAYNKLQALLLPGPKIERKNSATLLTAYRSYAPYREHYQLVNEIAPSNAKAGDALHQFYREWAGLWQEVNSAFTVEHTLNLQAEHSELLSKISDKKTFTDVLLELILEPSNDLLQSAGELFDLPHINKHLAREGDRHARGLPPIRFDHYEMARNAYRRLLRAPEEQAKQFNIDNLIEEDPSLYSFCIYLSASQCVFNHLDRAMIFARQAAMIGDRGRRKDPTCYQYHCVNGREAHYLLAYLTRLLTRTNKHPVRRLKQAEQFLFKAGKILLQETGKDSPKPTTEPYFDWYLNLGDLRLTSLYLSIQISHYMLVRYAGQPIDDEENGDVSVRLKRILEQLEICIGRFNVYIGENRAAQKKYEFKILQGDLLCNALVLLIELYILDPEELSKDKADNFLQDLHSNLWAEFGRERLKEQIIGTYINKEASEYIQLIYYMSELLFTDNIDMVVKDKYLDICQKRLASNRFQFFVYDKVRFSEYANILSEVRMLRS